jgi:hypothetical protein
MSEKRLTSYCGLYCLDCIPSNRCLFEILKSFENQLKKTKFEKYAKVKSVANLTFKKYSDFQEVLTAIKNLECKAPCRENGGFVDCKIRSCAINKNYEGCWECGSFKSCELLSPIKKIHPLLDNNLGLIKHKGVDNWSPQRGKHYSWSKKP